MGLYSCEWRSAECTQRTRKEQWESPQIVGSEAAHLTMTGRIVITPFKHFTQHSARLTLTAVLLAHCSIDQQVVHVMSLGRMRQVAALAKKGSLTQ